MSEIENVRELLNRTNSKLEEQMNNYDRLEKKHTDILKAFGLESLIYKVPLEIFTQHDMNAYDHVHQIVLEKVNEELNKFFISQLETKVHSLQSFNSSVIDRKKSMNKILEKFKNEFQVKSEDANQDLLNISALQTSVHELQSKIHHANEQQELKKNIVAKFQECSQIKNRTEKCKEEDKVLMKELEHYRPLPPDLDEAQKKLDQLRQKFRQISDELTHIIQKGY